ncbi:MAG: CoA-binding protein [Dehalococcoidia bacterium]|jgi:acetyltransferase
MDNVRGLKSFFEPDSIAIIGLSRKTGPGTYNALENLLNYGYSGRLYPVNPNASEIAGVKAYASINDIPDPVDLAVISTPRSRVPQHIRDCAARGIRCVSILTQGFNDAGDEEGNRLFGEIKEIAAATGCRVLGPNSFGSANYFHKFCSAFARVSMQASPVGLVSQTGGIFNGVSEFRFVGKGIDVGNICNVDFADCLEYFEQDPQVKVIALHIEGMPDPRRFIDTARRVSRHKPIVALKTGRSRQAVKAAQSHTGSLAGITEIWDAAFSQAGIISVDSLEEMLDVTRALYMLPALTNPNICVATFSGGAAIMAMDAMQGTDLLTPAPSSTSREQISKLAPSWLGVGNPVDYWPMVMGSESVPRSIDVIMEILLSDRTFGGWMFIQIVPNSMVSSQTRVILNGMISRHPDKPLVCVLTGPHGSEIIQELQNDGILAFPTPERASRALARHYRYHLRRSAL